jgi:fatty acid desaturase
MVSADQGWVRSARLALASSGRDFFRISPARYWFDFLLTAALTSVSSTIYFNAPLLSWPQLVAFPFTVFWLYRLGSLIHEVAHLPHNEMRVFKVVWNLMVGVTTLTPSPFYTRQHRDHHTLRIYGTPQDPEYTANVCEPGSARSLLLYALTILVFPLLVFLRFLLAPLTFLHPRLREFTLRRLSSLMFNWRYERKVSPFDRWAMTSLELLCCARAAFIPIGVLTGVLPLSRIPLLYLLAISTLAMNQMRQLADHRLESSGGQLPLEAHLHDSCNYTSRDFLTWLFFPFAIRYHALHHLFPSLPYHNLSAAHKRLKESLPADSPYHLLEQPSWWSTARHIFQRRQIGAGGQAELAQP